MDEAGKKYDADRWTTTPRRWLGCALLAGGLSLGVGGPADGAILVIDRLSEASNVGAVSGGASSFNDDDSLMGLDGAFSFFSSRAVETTVRPARQATRVIAESTGVHTARDAVTFDGEDALTLAVGRSSSGSTFSNGASATLTQTQIFRVDFRVTDTAVDYDLSGTFQPGGSTTVSRVWLGLVGGAAEVDVDSDASTSFDQQGQLAPLTDPAATYRFVVELDQAIAGNAGLAGSIDLELLLLTVPEPSTAAVLMGVGLIFTRRTRQTPR